MHSENMEIRNIGNLLFHRKFGKYHPKAEKAIYALIKRFYINCLKR